MLRHILSSCFIFPSKSVLVFSCIYCLIVSSNISAAGARLGSPWNTSEVLSDAVAHCFQDTEGDARRRWRQVQGQMICSLVFCTELHSERNTEPRRALC